MVLESNIGVIICSLAKLRINFSQILRVPDNNTAEMTECIVLSPIADGKSSQEWNNKK